jgi:hypothetical protein
MESLRELASWALLLWGVGTLVFGLVRWSKGGASDVYSGLILIVLFGVFLPADGVLSDKAAMYLGLPAAVFLVVWRIRQGRGRWPRVRPTKAAG